MGCLGLHFVVEESLVDEFGFAVEEGSGFEFEALGGGVVVDADADAFAGYFVGAERFVELHAEVCGVVAECLEEVFVPEVVGVEGGVEVPEGAVVEYVYGLDVGLQFGVLLEEAECPLVDLLHGPFGFGSVGCGVCDAVGHEEVVAGLASVVVVFHDHAVEPGEVSAYFTIEGDALGDVWLEELAVLAPDVDGVESIGYVGVDVSVFDDSAAAPDGSVVESVGLVDLLLELLYVLLLLFLLPGVG